MGLPRLLLLMMLALGLGPGCDGEFQVGDPDGPEEVPDDDENTGDDDATDDDDSAAEPEQVPGAEYTQMPVMLIDTFNQSIPEDYKTDAYLEVVRDHDGTLDDLWGRPRTYSGPIGIEVHGSSSVGYPKQGFRFETRDEFGEDVNVGLLDLPAESDWVLHGPYCDKTYFRNTLAYAMGRTLGEQTGHWQPRTEFIELFVNGDYRGLYVLIERVKRDEDRVDIPVPAVTANQGDLTGGYIIRIDQHRNDGWDTQRGTVIDYYYPKYVTITAEQDAYIKDYFERFEEMLSGSDWADPVTGYPAWINVESFIDHFIVNEISHNIDAYRLSAYLYKESDLDGGLLHAGPLWDFDRAWGNVNYCDCFEIQGFIIDSLIDCGEGYQFPFWWLRLLEDPAFTTRLRCRWEELRGTILSEQAIAGAIAAMAEEVSAVEQRDHDRWGNLGAYVDPNYYVGDTYQQELDYLEGWAAERALWLDWNIPGTCE